MSRPSALDLLLPGWTRIRVHRPLLAPLLLGWAFAAVAAWSLHPFLLGSPAAGSDAARSMLLAGLWVLAMLAPLFALLRAGGLALLTWSAATLSGADRPVGELLSIFLYGDCLRGFVGLLLVIWFHVAATLSRGAPVLIDPTSLAKFVPSSHSGWSAVAGMVSLTSIVWLVFTALALRRVSGFRPLATAGLVALVAVVALVATYLRASLGGI